MALNKVHLLHTDPRSRPARTACGMVGWQCSNSETEFDTAACNRFEAQTKIKGVTCKRCLAAEPRAPEPLRQGQRR